MKNRQILTKALLRNFYANEAPHDSYWLMRHIFIRGLGLIYFNAFLIFFFQGSGLFSSDGLTPIASYVQNVQNSLDSVWLSFWRLPTLFHFFSSDFAITALPVIGVFLTLPLIMGMANFPLLFALWLLQLSMQNAGQIFYSYGWESQLLELTFLSFFLCPLLSFRLDSPQSPPKKIAILFQRWMLFRLMLGAGLIKIRGDECWRDLTCTFYHYETQPNPHPLSWYLHHLPDFIHKGEVLFNHFVEIIVPFVVFGPAPLRRFAGVIIIIFQGSLIISGNLSWLNWLTILMTIPCFDDQFLRRIFNWPRLSSFSQKWKTLSFTSPRKVTLVVLTLFTLFGLYSSIRPALNLLSPRQRMNSSFNQFHLINSYGAFGSITKERKEIIIKGTTKENPSPSDWKEYEFKCKPGNVSRAPCLITPYHYRLDWQIWFSAMRPRLSERWLARLAYKLLKNTKNVTNLLEENPFPESPPRKIRMDLYRYKFSDWQSEKWWEREYLKRYMPAMTKSRLKKVLRSR